MALRLVRNDRHFLASFRHRFFVWGSVASRARLSAFCAFCRASAKASLSIEHLLRKPMDKRKCINGRRVFNVSHPVTTTKCRRRDRVPIYPLAASTLCTVNGAPFGAPRGDTPRGQLLSGAVERRDPGVSGGLQRAPCASEPFGLPRYAGATAGIKSNVFLTPTSVSRPIERRRGCTLGPAEPRA